MEKILKWVKIINLIVIVLFFPIMIVVSLYSLDAIRSEGLFNTTTISFIGYLIALVCGIFSFKKGYFITLSLIGWLIFVTGNVIDSKAVEEGRGDICFQLRSDSNCIEDEEGTINCKKGTHAGVYSLICKDIAK